jgi:hypothetical protein
MAGSTHNTSDVAPPPDSTLATLINRCAVGLGFFAITDAEMRDASLADVLRSAVDTGHDDAVHALLETAEDNLAMLDSALRDQDLAYTAEQLARIILRVERHVRAAREIHSRQIRELLPLACNGGAK